jgi:hypothetical protein
VGCLSCGGHLAGGNCQRASPGTLACFTEAPDGFLFGPDEGAQAIGPVALRAFFAGFYAEPCRILFALPERRISVAGIIAWLVGEGPYRLSAEPGEQPWRLVGVLE